MIQMQTVLDVADNPGQQIHPKRRQLSTGGEHAQRGERDVAFT